MVLFDVLKDIILYIIENIFNDTSNLPYAYIGIAAIYSTILISVAITIFRKEENSNLDRNVILDYIIGGPRFLLYICFICVPGLLWGVLPQWTRILGFIFRSRKAKAR